MHQISSEIWANGLRGPSGTTLHSSSNRRCCVEAVPTPWLSIRECGGSRVWSTPQRASWLQQHQHGVAHKVVRVRWTPSLSEVLQGGLYLHWRSVAVVLDVYLRQQWQQLQDDGRDQWIKNYCHRSSSDRHSQPTIYRSPTWEVWRLPWSAYDVLKEEFWNTLWDLILEMKKRRTNRPVSHCPNDRENHPLEHLPFGASILLGISRDILYY